MTDLAEPTRIAPPVSPGALDVRLPGAVRVRVVRRSVAGASRRVVALTGALMIVAAHHGRLPAAARPGVGHAARAGHRR